MSLENIFFLTYPVGLENLGEEELALKWPLHFPTSSYKVQNRGMGGIEIECPIEIGFLLNQILKCPSRILLRLHSFKCRDVPKLFQKTSKFNWAPYLLSPTPKVHISATESRLFDSRKIEKAFHDGVTEFFRHQPMKKKYQELNSAVSTAPEIYIRFFEDTCSFSLDTTGDLLHKRGDKLLTGHAPLRESLASLLLMAIGTSPTATLIDPMCGSGTFLIEAYDFFNTNNSREFSYMNTPFYRELKTHMPLPGNQSQKFFSKYLGLDNDQEIINEATINIGERNITVSKQDIFPVQKITESECFVILNPPYGKRVGNKSEIDLKYYLNILKAIKNNYGPKKIGIIIPQEFSLRSTKEMNILQAIPFKNGGIPVVFYIIQ